MLPEVTSDTVDIDLLGHATVLMRLGSIRLLFDPHLLNDFAEGHFGYFPSRVIDAGRFQRLDAIVISHSHRDHFDPRSLALLPRSTPVLCPRDMRIEFILRGLGFSEVLTVTDWTTLQPRQGIRLLWTPSTYRVPEHGVAIRFGNIAIWNVVDTVVDDPRVIERVLSTLGRTDLDLLMLPCHPLLETAITDGKFPAYEPGDFLDTITVAELSRARHVLPFADGHYCLGRAAWMNQQKFPLSDNRIRRLLQECHPTPQIIEGGPGDVIRVDTDGHVRLYAGASAVVQRIDEAQFGDQQSRTFFPGRWIPPLRADATDPTVVQKFREVFTRAADPDAEPLAAPVLAPRQAPRELLESLYRFILVDEQGSPIETIEVAVDASGRLSIPKAIGCVDIEVALSASDFVALLDGSLSFAAAFLGGRLREIRPALATRSPVGIIIRVGDRMPSCGKAMLSGVLILNLALNREPMAALQSLRRELQVCSGELPPSAFPAGAVELSARAVAAETYAAEFAQIFEAIELALLAGRDPTSASRSLVLGGQVTFVGVIGRENWPLPSESTQTGFLLPHVLLEAQPHLGGGVRFPDTSYAALLENILRSRVQEWTVVRPGTGSVPIPAWRRSSLFPIDPDRLRRDLAARGWTGVVHAPETGSQSTEWWRGMPVLRDAVLEEHSEVLPLLGYKEVCYRFEHADAPEWAERRLVDHLVLGDFRFSWVLSPDDTFASFERSQVVGFERWTELMAVDSLSRCLSRAHKRTHATE